MRGKIISLIIVLIIISVLIWIFFAGKFFTTQTSSEYQNITDLRTVYDAEPEIAAGLKKMQSNPEPAAVVGKPASNLRQIAITFDGLADRAIIEKILDMLTKYKINATFFVDGIQAAEDPQAVVNIRKAGQKIENYSLLGLAKMENIPAERLVKDFCRSQKIIKVTTDHGPNLLKLNDTVYTERVLQAANACGFKGVVKSDVFLTGKNAGSVKAAGIFVSKLASGSIVSVKLKPNLDPIVNERGAIDLRPAVDKQPGLKVLPKQVTVDDNEIIKATENLIIALNQEKMTTVYVDTFPTTQSSTKTAANVFILTNIKSEVMLSDISFNKTAK
ncbi:MAG: polysaccharide deacetylase family protein [Negativicutes bacterium]